MTVSDLDILRAGHRISSGMATRRSRKHAQRIRTLKERGGNDIADTWLRIIVAIREMRQEPSGPDPAPNRG
jgi:hypothetical protein